MSQPVLSSIAPRTSDTSFICCFPSCLTRRNRGKWRSEHMKHQEEEPRKCQGKQCAPRVLYPSGGFQRRVCIVFPGGGLRWVLLLLCSHRLPTSQRGFASLVCLHCPLNSGLSLLADSFEVLIPAWCSQCYMLLCSFCLFFSFLIFFTFFHTKYCYLVLITDKKKSPKNSFYSSLMMPRYAAV